MRLAVVWFFFTVVIGVANASGNARPAGRNCALAAPPASAGEESDHGIIFRIFPRAKDINTEYSGCQALLIQDEAKWVLVSLTEVLNGDPVRIWSEGNPSDPALSCRYSKGKVVSGSSGTCPLAKSLLVKSMAPGCVRRIQESLAQGGSAVSRPQECKYE
jgi:hypothetical protein